MMTHDDETYEVICAAIPLKRRGGLDFQAHTLDDEIDAKLENEEALARSRIIRNGVEEFRRLGPTMKRSYPGRTWQHWVNGALTIEGMSKLTPEEIKEHGG